MESKKEHLARRHNLRNSTLISLHHRQLVVTNSFQEMARSKVYIPLHFQVEQCGYEMMLLSIPFKLCLNRNSNNVGKSLILKGCVLDKM